MNNQINNEISQITIYLKRANDSEEKLNEVTLIGPLLPKKRFEEKTSSTLSQRKWDFYHNLSFFRRWYLRLHSFFLRKLYRLISSERKTHEAKLKTALAILLAQESLRELLLGTEKSRNNFVNTVQKVARAYGNVNFPLEKDISPLNLSRQLTWLSNKNKSLIDDLVELNLQMAALDTQERNEIFYKILNQVERPPITSVLEIVFDQSQITIESLTKYAKYKVDAIDDKSRKILFNAIEDQATSSIRTQENTRPGFKGAINQRIAFDRTQPQMSDVLGAYSGELITVHNVLEQILFLVEQGFGKKGSFYLHDASPSDVVIPLPILFTSLFSWHELDNILNQSQAIHTLNRKVLQVVHSDGTSESFQLQLYHRNIPFNALNKFPTPGETEAVLNDMNEESLLFLTRRTFAVLHSWIPSDERVTSQLKDLQQLETDWEALTAYPREESTDSFFQRQKRLYELIDLFRNKKKEIVDVLSHLLAATSQDRKIFEIAFSLRSLYENRGGINELIYTQQLTRHLGILHTKNCKNSTDRSAGANSQDKAQNAFHKLYGHFFLPDQTSEGEKEIFKVLYSMYLVWEEPELTSGMSTGFVGEKFYNNFLQRNPETTHYLIDLLKEHPEMYLGLSPYRS